MLVKHKWDCLSREKEEDEQPILEVESDEKGRDRLKEMERLRELSEELAAETRKIFDEKQKPLIKVISC